MPFYSARPRLFARADSRLPRMLERGGLIEMSKVVTLVVVRLTAKGEEVGNGLVLAEGVLKPGVDCPY